MNPESLTLLPATTSTSRDRLFVQGWPGAYQREMAIPLANLGDYMILVSVK